VKILSTKTGEVQHKIKKHTEWVTAVAFSPNGEMLASADRNGGISIWDPDNAQELFTLAGHKTAATALSWRADSKLLASSSEDGAVKIWELKEGKQVKTWVAHAGGALCVSYASDARLVSCGRDNGVILWDSNGNKVRAMAGPLEIPLRATFTCDTKQIITSDFAGRVSVWNVNDGKLAADLDANPLPSPGQIAEAKPPIRSKPSIKRR
jgi:WD40 repeat protein